MHKTLAALAAILAVPLFAQTQPQPTPAELLQKGIFAQETSGDLDGAIKIYRQIAELHPQQRELGAQAQYRLGMTLLAKGDTNAASQEIQRLGWDYPDFKDLIASAKKGGAYGGGTYGDLHVFRFTPSDTELQQLAENRDRTLFNAGQPAQHEALFDFKRSTTITGTVVQVAWMNPYTMLTINTVPSEPPSKVFVASSNTLEVAGWTRGTVRLGDQITITGAPAVDASPTLQATSVTFNGQVIFSRPNGPLPQVAIGAYEK
jgi:tetratricopeptide (TPR) repeat protein